MLTSTSCQSPKDKCQAPRKAKLMVGSRCWVSGPRGAVGTGSWDLVDMEAQICKMNEFWRQMVTGA